MPIDPSIALSYKPIQLENPLNAYAQASQIRAADNQNALAQYQISSAQRNDALQNQMLSELRASGGDPTKIANAYINAGKGDVAYKLQKDQADIAQSQAKTAEIKNQLIGGALVSAHADPSDANLTKIAQGLQLQGIDAGQHIAQLTQMPDLAQRQQYIKSIALGTKEGREALQALQVKAEKVDNGQSISQVNTNPLAGQVGAPIAGAPVIAKQVSPDTAATNANRSQIAANQNNLQLKIHGLNPDGTLSSNAEKSAQAIAAGNLAPLSGFALSRPGAQQIMARVMEINPNYSAKDFDVGKVAEKNFTSGKNGNAVRSFNVALSHLDTLGGLADALQNGDIKVFNKLGNAYATQTGAPAPTNFESAKKIVADEIVKAIVGSGGGVADREAAANTISAASSPAQLKGVINTYKELMRGQLGGLRQQYETSTGRKDFDRFLSPAGKQAAHAGGDVHPVISAADAILAGR